jgi:gluconokinase
MPGSDPLVIVVTGVSGSGKSTVGRALSDRLGWRFYDADDLHSPEAIAQMRAGTGLDDAMRQPWLRRVRATIQDVLADNASAVVACSALKASYRRVIADGIPAVRFVFLDADREVLLRRLETRQGHFAGAALLDSQLAALEPPAEALHLDASRPVSELVEAIVKNQAGPDRSGR